MPIEIFKTNTGDIIVIGERGEGGCLVYDNEKKIWELKKKHANGLSKLASVSDLIRFLNDKTPKN